MNDFTDLDPQDFLPVLEEAMGIPLTPLIRPFSSYINRVYEIETTEEISYVAKFYRPGRWTVDALRNEHEFILDCAGKEIPVVCPIKLVNGETLGQMGKIPFTVFPKRSGRNFDIENEESLQRIGMLLGRIHNAGQAKKAPSRLILHPEQTTRKYVDQLYEEGLSKDKRQKFKDICYRIIDTISPFFEGIESIRIHGDFHIGNILDRPDTGLMVIDFDDMMNGPPVQDIWLLLADHYPACKDQLEIVLSGYRQFRDFDPRSTILIEGLRAMRMIYFTAWCNMQRNDYQFKNKFPDWGSESFWSKEIGDLYEQYSHIIDMDSD